MLQNGCSPSFAIPPEKVTACPSAMPTSNARFGIFSISMFIEQPLGMAGVTPTTFGLASASSTSVFPNTSWKSGGIPSVLAMKRSPVTGSNLPGACHSVACFSAGPNPFPLIVCRCRILGPCISLMSRNTLARFFTSCPSIGPK